MDPRISLLRFIQDYITSLHLISLLIGVELITYPLPEEILEINESNFSKLCKQCWPVARIW